MKGRTEELRCECCRAPIGRDLTARTVCGPCYHRHGYDYDGICPTPENTEPREAAAVESDAACWLCSGLGGIALHLRWSGERGKPLWTAHEHPSSDPHTTWPCPACAAPEKADQKGTP